MNVRIPGGQCHPDPEPPVSQPGAIIADHATYYGDVGTGGVTSQRAGQNMAEASEQLVEADRAYLSRLKVSTPNAVGAELTLDDEPSALWLRIGMDASKIPPHIQELLREVVAPALRAWIASNPQLDSLGVRAQYVDMHRLMEDLARAVWNSTEVGDSTAELLQELLGHVILALHYTQKGTNDANL